MTFANFPLAARLLAIVLTVTLLFACDAASPPELAIVPLPPTYRATATPTVAPLFTVVPKNTPTLSPATRNLSAGAAATPLPTITPVGGPIPVRDLMALSEYQRGIAFVALGHDDYQSAESQQSLDNLFATGANFISLLVTWYQGDWRSTRIYPSDQTATDEELTYVINYAHAHGIKVLLKPQIDFAFDFAHWRGEIAFGNEADWRAWFDSYREFILHYARFAQANSVEEFSVGTELVAASTRTQDWRAIIRAVRQEYTGLLTYAANHSGEEVAIEFWDDLDFIGVNVFYHLTNFRGPTVDMLLEAWELPVVQLTRLHNRFPNRPIIFTEVGYRSMDRANVWPWDWQLDGLVDLQEQADLYEAMFETWWKQPERSWFRGLFIWNWRADPNHGGANDQDYTPHNKPAEEILKRYFLGSQEFQSIGTP